MLYQVVVLYYHNCVEMHYMQTLILYVYSSCAAAFLATWFSRWTALKNSCLTRKKKPKHTFPILFQCRDVCRGASHLDHERADHTINARKT